MVKEEMMDKIIQYQMREIKTGDVRNALNEYTETLLKKNNENLQTAVILKQRIKEEQSKLKVATDALNDIILWNDTIEDNWGDQCNRAGDALEKISFMEGF